MKKPLKKTSVKRNPGTGHFIEVTSSQGAAKGRFMGVTQDGVKILRPKFPPKNFTEKELQNAVAKALGKSA